MLGNNRKITVITGISGAGKTTVLNQLADIAFTMSWDKTRDEGKRAALLEAASNQPKPVLMEISRLVSTTIKRTPDFNFELVIVTSQFEDVRARCTARSGKFNEAGALGRLKRMQSLKKKYGAFEGTQEQVLGELRQRFGAA